MLNFETEKMKKQVKNIYLYLQNNTNSWNIKVSKTKWRNKISNNSYCFDIPNIESGNDKIKIISEYLKNIFKISVNEINDFERSLEEACSGSGNEAEKITILRSSSLCCLLNFYNVREKPIYITINNKKVCFNQAFFEVKNEVINNPSNIDVVLISENNNYVLFLESKFSEYYIDKGPIQISKQYLSHDISKHFYNNKVLEKIDSFIIMENDKPKILKDENGTDVFILDTNKTIRKRTKGYVGGIKQIISHYIGLNNFIKTKIIKGNKINPKAKILLGEIVFDFPEQTDMHDYLIDYEKKYTSLATILNNNSEIMVLPSLLHFSNYKERLNDTIKQFYYGI